MKSSITETSFLRLGSSSGPSTATWPRLRLPKIADELHVVPPSFELQATTVWLDAPSG